MVLLSLFLLVCFRRKKNKVRRKGGVGLWERKRYHKPSLNLSPDGGQAPIARPNVGEPVHQNHVQPTPYVLPDTRSSAALSYYGDNPTSPIQNRSSQYLLPSSVPTSTNYQQQRPEDRPRSQSYGWQSGYAYPPPSSTVPSNYSQNSYQGTMSSTGQRLSYNADTVTTATHISPQRTLTTLGTSGYSDNVSHHSMYTVQNPAPSQGSEWTAPVQVAAVSAASQKAAEPRQDTGKPQLGQPLQPTGGAPLVYQHQDAIDIVELPPAYREWSASAPPPP